MSQDSTKYSEKFECLIRPGPADSVAHIDLTSLPDESASDEVVRAVIMEIRKSGEIRPYADGNDEIFFKFYCEFKPGKMVEAPSPALRKDEKEFMTLLKAASEAAFQLRIFIEDSDFYDDDLWDTCHSMEEFSEEIPEDDRYVYIPAEEGTIEVPTDEYVAYVNSLTNVHPHVLAELKRIAGMIDEFMEHQAEDARRYYVQS